MANTMANLQSLGRALMLPIAVLPAAGLLLRLGQPDLLNIDFVAAAGNALFANLGLLFAIGVAVGFAREGHGAAGLAGAVCFLVSMFGAKIFIDVPQDLFAGVPDQLHGLVEGDFRDKVLQRLSVPIGIISGLTAGLLYNKYANIRLPEYLAFFGGKRFVPIASACVGIAIAAVFGLGAGAANSGIAWLGEQIVGAGGIGLFVYGTLNRLLIATGLHHILNNIPWFVIGEYNGATGDLNRFFAGDPEAGAFMAGFFPVMMFGLPAACYAIYHAALPERRKEVGGMLGSMALTAFLTGVTEPVEFTFMFLAPLLYACHAILTGLSMAIMDLLNVKLGFAFSAGLFDYLINFRASTNPLWLIPVGIAYALVYYFVFVFAIRFFNVATPGREPAVNGAVDSTAANGSATPSVPQAANGVKAKADGPSEEAIGYIAALGGAQNIETIGACTTRLRLTVRDASSVNDQQLKALGAKAVVRPSKQAVQVIIGPQAELLADAMSEVMRTPASPADDAMAGAGDGSPGVFSDLTDAVKQALGGTENLAEGQWMQGNRLQVRVNDMGKVQFERLEALNVFVFDRGAESDQTLHLLFKDASHSPSA